MTPLLQMRTVTKAFYGVQVLKGVDFDVAAGEVHVLLGENGAGKSTLMKILSGAYTLDSGDVLFDGEPVDLRQHTPRRAEEMGIVTIYQNFHLIPHLSVAENASLHLFTQGRGLVRWNEVYAHAQRVLDRINFTIDLRARVRDLPVSQKQMLEIAIALSKNARILVMDEPTAALSRNETQLLFATIADIKAQGVGIVYISHRLDELKIVGDRITVLRDGMNVATVPAKDADMNKVISMMIGKSLADRVGHQRSDLDTQEVLRLADLSSDRTQHPVSLSVHAGEIVGVTGLVGAGKTEMARALFGADKLNSGTVYLNSKPTRIDSPRHAIELGIGYLPEDRDADGLFLNHGVKENISLVTLTKLRRWFFNRDAEAQMAGRMVRSLGIRAASLSQQVCFLSGGNKQKVIFAKWLSARCNVLILDEPTIGIDVGARGEIYDLVREFVDAEPGRAVLFISSDMDEVLEVTNRVLVLAGGKVTANLETAATSKQEIMQYAMAAVTT